MGAVGVLLRAVLLRGAALLVGVLLLHHAVPLLGDAVVRLRQTALPGDVGAVPLLLRVRVGLCCVSSVPLQAVLCAVETVFGLESPGVCSYVPFVL